MYDKSIRWLSSLKGIRLMYPVLLLLGSLLVATMTMGLFARAEKSPTLLVFTANWCASCRDILPTVQSLATAKGYLIQLVDVDQELAPKLAREYGLTLNKLEPPQVYFITAGKAPLLLLDESSDASNATALMRQKLP